MTRSLIPGAILTLMLMSAAPLAHAQAHIVPNQQKAGDADATQAPTSGGVTAPTWLNLPTAADFAAGMPVGPGAWDGPARPSCDVSSSMTADWTAALR
jgi:hypothetical protein